MNESPRRTLATLILPGAGILACWCLMVHVGPELSRVAPQPLATWHSPPTWMEVSHRIGREDRWVDGAIQSNRAMRIAECLLAKGRHDEGREALWGVIRTWPDFPAANLAFAKLWELEESEILEWVRTLRLDGRPGEWRCVDPQCTICFIPREPVVVGKEWTGTSGARKDRSGSA